MQERNLHTRRIIYFLFSLVHVQNTNTHTAAICPAAGYRFFYVLVVFHTLYKQACSKAAAEETGKFWFDRKPRRTHMPLSGTKLSEADRDALWNAVEQYCGD